MKALIALVLMLGLGWSAFWFVGSRHLLSEVETRLESEPSLDVQYSDISVRGFPNRFDVTIADLEVTDLKSGSRWAAPFLQILLLSYDWTHAIAVWPPTQSVSVGGEYYTIDSVGMRASAMLDLRPEFKLESITFESGQVKILNSNLLAASITDAVFAAKRHESTPGLFRIGMSIPKAELVRMAKSGSGGASNLNLAISNLLGDLRVRYGTSPRFGNFRSLETRISEISVDRLTSNLNGLDVSVDGSLEISASGHPVGELALELKNPQVLLDFAAASGVLSELQATVISFALPLLAERGSNAGAFRIPIQFKDGQTILAGTRIGPAWRLARE
ncbi:MAG: DUF2125 domain-containing protein [Albidovulum sp.]|nr:DUF2125 domain-containing protein [Albidovulum sp.]